MTLTVAEVKQKRDIEKPLKLSDGHGLFLLVKPDKDRERNNFLFL